MGKGWSRATACSWDRGGARSHPPEGTTHDARFPKSPGSAGCMSCPTTEVKIVDAAGRIGDAEMPVGKGSEALWIRGPQII